MLRREVRFEQAYDKRAEGKGQHGLDIRFLVHGDEGAVQFLIMTMWTIDGLKNPYIYSQERAFSPVPADLGFHSRKEIHSASYMGPCDVLDGADCWYDGSSSAAVRVFGVLLTEGDEGVWRELEAYYKEVFSEQG